MGSTNIILKKCIVKSCRYPTVFMNDFRMDTSKNTYIWLPTGDQLDEEIIKICREKGYTYYFIFTNDNHKYYKDYEAYLYFKHEDNNMYYQNYDNPLIAKIKLLLELL